MPRLINADAYLDKVCTYKTTGCGSCKFQTVCPADAPTVEAIPIGWLEMFMRRYKIEGGNEYKLLHFMVTEWEKWKKENDYRRTN